METNLQKNQSQNLEVFKKQVQEIGKEVYHINQLISFPMNDSQIEDIAKSIVELCPDLETGMLKNIIDNFKTGKYTWDKNENIQNIFRHICSQFAGKRHYYIHDNPNNELYNKYSELYDIYRKRFSY